MDKTQIRRSKLKVQLKSFDLQKETIDRSYGTETTVKRTSKSKLLETKFQIVKTMFKLIKQKEGLQTKILALVSLDLDK